MSENISEKTVGKTSSKAPLITASGDHYSFGHAIGKKTSDRINSLMENASLPAAQKKSMKFRKLFDRFFTICNKNMPEYVQEIRGMAEGAGVKFNDLLIFNLRELQVMSRPAGNPEIATGKHSIVDSVDNCSTLVVPKKDHVLAGHDEDGPTSNDVFMLNAKIDGQPRFLSVCYYGWLPGVAVNMNEHGLFQSLNAIRTTDMQVGIPVLFLARSTLKATTIQEAQDLIIKQKRARGENYIFYQGAECVNLETTATLHKSRVIKRPFAHTNHIIERELKHKQGLKKPNSVPRLKAARAFLKNNRVDRLESLKRALRDHTYAPYSLCTHDYKNVSTLAGVLFDTSKKELQVCHGFPCESKYYTYSL